MLDFQNTVILNQAAPSSKPSNISREQNNLNLNFNFQQSVNPQFALSPSNQKEANQQIDKI